MFAPVQPHMLFLNRQAGFGVEVKQSILCSEVVPAEAPLAGRVCQPLASCTTQLFVRVGVPMCSHCRGQYVLHGVHAGLCMCVWYS
jgi:hypothetical protein